MSASLTFKRRNSFVYIFSPKTLGNTKGLKSLPPHFFFFFFFSSSKFRADGEAEAPICWQPDVKSQLVGKDPDAGKD